MRMFVIVFVLRCCTGERCCGEGWTGRCEVRVGGKPGATMWFHQVG